MLRVAQVAERLNCSVSTAYGLIESGKLGHHRCPGVRVSEEQLAVYLEKTKREREEPNPAKKKPPRPKLRHITLR
jgi:excisionase family DNA binding protein